MVQEESKNVREQPDRFTALMFGPRKWRESKKETIPLEETVEEDSLIEKTSNEETSNEKYDWIMGKGSIAPTSQKRVEPTNNTIERVLQNIDYTEAAKHIGTLMSSANELKPLLGKVKPLIETFFPKKN